MESLAKVGQSQQMCVSAHAYVRTCMHDTGACTSVSHVCVKESTPHALPYPSSGDSPMFFEGALLAVEYGGKSREIDNNLLHFKYVSLCFRLPQVLDIIFEAFDESGYEALVPAQAESNESTVSHAIISACPCSGMQKKTTKSLDT